MLRSMGSQSRTRLSDWTELTEQPQRCPGQSSGHGSGGWQKTWLRTPCRQRAGWSASAPSPDRQTAEREGAGGQASASQTSFHPSGSAVATVDTSLSIETLLV